MGRTHTEWALRDCVVTDMGGHAQRALSGCMVTVELDSVNCIALCGLC